MEMERPCVVLLSCADENSTSALMKELIGKEIDALKILHEHVQASELRLETKYYIADVWFCRVLEQTVSKTFSDAVEAVVLFCDGKSLDPLNLWSSYLDQWDPATKILVCDCLSNDKVTEWSVRHGFEIVELDPDEESRQELEECGESFGAPRIMEILKTHPWSNAEMKEGPDAENFVRLREHLKELEREETPSVPDTLDALSAKFAEGNLVETQEISAVPSGSASERRDDFATTERNDAMLFAAVNGAEDPGHVSFEELFGQFDSMKKRAENLPESERKAYAEKVVSAFWKSIGGDDEEVAGLSSDDES